MENRPEIVVPPPPGRVPAPSPACNELLQAVAYVKHYLNVEEQTGKLNEHVSHDLQEKLDDIARSALQIGQQIRKSA